MVSKYDLRRECQVETWYDNSESELAKSAAIWVSTDDLEDLSHLKNLAHLSKFLEVLPSKEGNTIIIAGSSTSLVGFIEKHIKPKNISEKSLAEQIQSLEKNIVPSQRPEYRWAGAPKQTPFNDDIGQSKR